MITPCSCCSDLHNAEEPLRRLPQVERLGSTSKRRSRSGSTTLSSKRVTSVVPDLAAPPSAVPRRLVRKPRAGIALKHVSPGPASLKHAQAERGVHPHRKSVRGSSRRQHVLFSIEARPLFSLVMRQHSLQLREDGIAGRGPASLQQLLRVFQVETPGVELETLPAGVCEKSTPSPTPSGSFLMCMRVNMADWSRFAFCSPSSPDCLR